jgi:hypothetical protein
VKAALPAESGGGYRRQWGIGDYGMVDRPRDLRDEGPEEPRWFATWLALSIVLICVAHFVVLHMLKKHHRPIGWECQRIVHNETIDQAV